MKSIGIDTTKMASLGLLLLWGCTYGDTDLYNQQRGKVRIALDWGELAVPDSAAFYFYPSGQNTPLLRMSAGSGFEGTLAAGTYQVVVTNTDYSRLTVQTLKGYDQAFAYADAAGYSGPFDTRALEPALIESPQNLYGAGLAEITVEKNGATHIAYPQPLVYPVRLDVIVEGAVAVSEIEGILSGVSSSVHIPTGKADFSEDVSILFPLEKQAGGQFRSSATTFGLRPQQGNDEPQPNRLNLYIQMPDESVFSSELDITDLIEEAVGNVVTGTITATIELELTVDPSKPDGFNLELVGWRTGTGSAGEEE